jgi:hypothetical protein
MEMPTSEVKILLFMGYEAIQAKTVINNHITEHMRSFNYLSIVV